MIIRCKLNVSLVDKTKLFTGEKGKYMDITLLENKNGTDQYGNDFMVVQDIGKEARERGEKGPILGNGKYVGAKTSAPAPSQPAATPPASQPAFKPDDSDDIGF